jgi:hypothetical protein
MLYWLVADVFWEECRRIQSFQRDKGREAVSATT